MSALLERLALGTVQFGTVYGISNRRGKVIQPEVEDILRACLEVGVTTLDTANAYGDSEEVIGRALAATHSANKFQLVSKLHPSGDVDPVDALGQSCARLGVSRITGYLFHHFQTWVGSPNLWLRMQTAKTRGLAEKIGFSLYRPAELEALLAVGVIPEMIQVPYSLLDRRFESMFALCEERGIEVHTRSAFLQGLVFLEPTDLVPHFSTVRPVLTSLRSISASSGVPVSMLCLGYALLNPTIRRVVIGVESLANFQENCRVIDWIDLIASLKPQLDALSIADESILLPMNWPH